MHLNSLEEQEQIKLKTSRQKEIIKIREEINTIETKKQCKDSEPLKSGSLKRLASC